jgi:hypothetical protein
MQYHCVLQRDLRIIIIEQLTTFTRSADYFSKTHYF